MKRWIGSLAASSLVVVISWMFGNDLNQRGYEAGMTALIAVFVFFYAVICPFWSEK